MDKARDYYHDVKICPGSADRLFSYEDDEDEYLGPPRTRVSRRGSRYSSFGHSHSDSLELQEAMLGVVGRRDPSLELSDARGGSFSSEDSTPLHPKQRASSLDIRFVDTAPYSHPASPRTERKISPQSLYPNNLTVDIPPTLGPSIEEEGGKPRSRSPAPGRSGSRSGSPCSPLRGISYPPLSPKILKVYFVITRRSLYIQAIFLCN